VVVVQHCKEDDPTDKRDDKHGGNEWATNTGTVRGLRVKFVSQMVAREVKILTEERRYIVTNATAYGGTVNSL
jgi:hypothetical protein